MNFDGETPNTLTAISRFSLKESGDLFESCTLDEAIYTFFAPNTEQRCLYVL